MVVRVVFFQINVIDAGRQEIGARLDPTTVRYCRRFSPSTSWLRIHCRRPVDRASVNMAVAAQENEQARGVIENEVGESRHT